MRQFCVIILTSCMIPLFSHSAELKILDLNFNAESKNNQLKAERLPLFAQYLRDHDPDVVTIQESWNYNKVPNVAILVARDLNLDIAYQIENGVSGFLLSSTTILAKKNLHLRNVVRYKLPHSAFSIGDGQTWWIGFGASSFLLGGQITLPDGTEASVWTTHLTGSSRLQREDQISAAFKEMTHQIQYNWGQKWETASVLLTGDMNSPADSPELQFITQDMGMQDLWTLSHASDAGITFAGDVNLWEYNPISHGPDLIPSQYGEKEAQRVDQIYSHMPMSMASGITRVFTKPINHVWMSDHFGLWADLHLNDLTPFWSPSADSAVSDNGPTVRLEVTEEFMTNPPPNLDFNVETERGFSVSNTLDVTVEVQMDNHPSHVFTAPAVTLAKDETASFAFERSGHYHYTVTIRDYRPSPDEPSNGSLDPRVTELNGTLTVQLP